MHSIPFAVLPLSFVSTQLLSVSRSIFHLQQSSGGLNSLRAVGLHMTVEGTSTGIIHHFPHKYSNLGNDCYCRQGEQMWFSLAVEQCCLLPARRFAHFAHFAVLPF
jgi:hypothetical protein